MPVNSFDDYPMSWRPEIKKQGAPMYLAIADALERDIYNGVLPPNVKLPPQRELADFLDVNLSTVARAFKLCGTKGLISGSIGRGTYVAADVRANRPMFEEGRPGCIDMGASHPLYAQNKYVAEMLRKMARKQDIERILCYNDPMGTPAQLRNAEKWLNRFGVETEDRKIFIASGLQNSLAVLLASLFRYGDKIITNSVIYPGMKQAANLLGIQLLPLADGPGGIDWTYAEKLCRLERVKGIYLMPDCQNPTAHTMDREERRLAAEFIRENGLLCLEEGTYTFLENGRYPAVCNAVPEQAVYIAPVSNAVCAGLRLAFLLVPERFGEWVWRGISNINVMSSPIDRELVSQLISGGTAERIAAEKTAEIRRRNRILDEVLQTETGGSENSQFRWMHLPEGVDSMDVERELAARGLRVFGGDRFSVGNGKVSALRLAVCTPENEEELRKGLGILRDYLDMACWGKSLGRRWEGLAGGKAK